MKSIFTILIFIPIFSFSQKNEIEQRAIKWFKSVYVETKFKDPYSYKFIKVKSIPLSTLEYYKSERIIPILQKMGRKEEYATTYDTSFVDEAIKMYKELSNTKSLTKEDRDKYHDLINDAKECRENMDLINHMQNENKVRICRYVIYIDCYSNNSYGNKVFGRYAFYYYPYSSPFYEFDRLYSYKDFMIDDKTIFQLN